MVLFGITPASRNFLFHLPDRHKLLPKYHWSIRCNLTVLLEPGQEDLAEFLARNKVGLETTLGTAPAVEDGRVVLS